MARRGISSLFSRVLTTSSSSTLPYRLPAAFAAVDKLRQVSSRLAPASIRWKTTSNSGYSPIKDSSPNWSNRPPKETILLDGCDYEHWLIVMEFAENPKPSEEEMVAAYVKTLTSVLESEEEAKKKIYSVCTTTYTGFGALISEELSYKVKGLPGVLWVLPDSYLDVPNKDYGGDLFVDGKVIHRPQFRFTERQQSSRNRPRPRYDRRREIVPVERREPMQRGMPTPVSQADSQQNFSNPQQNFSNPQQNFSNPQQNFSNPQQNFSNPQQNFSNPQQNFQSSQEIVSCPQNSQ